MMKGAEGQFLRGKIGVIFELHWGAFFAFLQMVGQGL
jgi:hypothetical protein